MRLLVLSKRQYTNRDLIDDRFGRLRELPLALASMGHDVQGVCLSYRCRHEGLYHDTEGNAHVAWYMLNIKHLLPWPWDAKTYWHTIDRIEDAFQPDLIWACSDAWHAILGVCIAKRMRVPLIIDLYDNFESFPATRLPGITAAFRRALRIADGITCVSGPLSQYVRETCGCKNPIEVIENAVPDGLFRPMDKTTCRQSLGLPTDEFLIGTAGAISKSRGIETLFEAFALLAHERSDVHLVLAGACDKGLTLPRGARIHYLGMLPVHRVPLLLSALNIAVVCNRESAFGNYCFPQKFYEGVACGVPVVASATGPMRELLKDSPYHLFEPENVQHLVTVLRRQITNPVAVPLEAPTWTVLGHRLEEFLRFCLAKAT